MSENFPKNEEGGEEDIKKKVERTTIEMLDILRNESAAIKAYEKFMGEDKKVSDRMGTGGPSRVRLMEALNEHPDVKLYYALEMLNIHDSQE